MLFFYVPSPTHVICPNDRHNPLLKKHLKYPIMHPLKCQRTVDFSLVLNSTFAYSNIRKEKLKMIVLKLLAAVWGACLASFINTVIWRLLNQISLFDPQRSYCDSCHQQLIWWQLIPVIGWLIQKVSFCHASIGCYSTFSELINGWLWYELFILDPKIITALLILSTSLLVCSATDYFAQWIWPIWLIGLFSLFWLLNQKWQWLRLSAAIAILGGLLIMSF